MKMINYGMYGLVYVPGKVFDNIPHDMVIPNSAFDVKILCNNTKETEMLIENGVVIGDEICADWYKVLHNRK